MRPLPVHRNGDGSATYTTLAGDILDHICWRHYGQEWDATEATLAANRELAGLGAVLPGGITIVLPAIAVTATPVKARRRLFD